MGEKKGGQKQTPVSVLGSLKRRKKGNWAMKQIKVDLAPLPLIPFTYYEVEKGKKIKLSQCHIDPGKKV